MSYLAQNSLCRYLCRDMWVCQPLSPAHNLFGFWLQMRTSGMVSPLCYESSAESFLWTFNGSSLSLRLILSWKVRMPVDTPLSRDLQVQRTHKHGQRACESPDGGASSNTCRTEVSCYSPAFSVLLELLRSSVGRQHSFSPCVKR